tara:strand:+ start:130 stop:243 length:114 start_codon:yes stop_codon:yes gene_type:complete
MIAVEKKYARVAAVTIQSETSLFIIQQKATTSSGVLE